MIPDHLQFMLSSWDLSEFTEWKFLMLSLEDNTPHATPISVIKNSAYFYLHTCSGELCYRLCTERDYKAVYLITNKVGQNELEFILKVRAVGEPHCDIPIILISPPVSKTIRHELEDCGITAVLEAPFSDKQLIKQTLSLCA
ncbi:hypothetical protein [Kordiimonas laminariae]|uniref:hypothetical protein n=1 Tax=Kordiimonas laminariae TaxID=2917717 RepID=UPI001FF1960B|nr:hypothetical protein [Kordiimonas laminariae]MCK0068989.1 hypothetical protein [Kordiimonas laminariae]